MGASTKATTMTFASASSGDPHSHHNPLAAQYARQRSLRTRPDQRHIASDDNAPFVPQESGRPRITHAASYYGSFPRPPTSLAGPMNQAYQGQRSASSNPRYVAQNDARDQDRDEEPNSQDESSSGDSEKSADSPESYNCPLPSQSADQNPPVRVNRELYPAYDEHGIRRGMEHLNGVPGPGGSYYQERTYDYPTQGQSVPVEPESVPMRQQTDEPPVYAADPRLLQMDPSNQVGFSGFDVTVAEVHAPEEQVHPTNNQYAQFVYMEAPPGQTRQPLRPPPGTQISDEDLAVLMHLEPGTPISLASLHDPPPGLKPDYSLPTLVKLAIWGSERKMLTLQEIYEAIERRFEWYKPEDKSWRDSIRHTLSLVAIFQKKPRPITEPGKGQYWYLDFTQKEGNKRERKRNKKPAKTRQKQVSTSPSLGDMDIDELEVTDNEVLTNSQRGAAPQAAPRRSGQSNRRASRVASRGRSAPYSTPEPSPASTQLPPAHNRQIPRGHRGRDMDMSIDPVLLGTSPDSRYPLDSNALGIVNSAPQQASAVIPVPGSSNSTNSTKFGQPAFGSSGFGNYVQPRPTGFAAFANASSSLANSNPSVAAPFDRNAPVNILPREGREIISGPGGLPMARRVNGATMQRPS